MTKHQFSWYGNVNKLVKTVILLSIPVGILAIVFWNVYPITKIVLVSFIGLVGVGVLDRLLSWSLSGYEYRRREFFALLIGVIVGVILVSNGILPRLVINVVD